MTNAAIRSDRSRTRCAATIAAAVPTTVTSADSFVSNSLADFTWWSIDFRTSAAAATAFAATSVSLGRAGGCRLERSGWFGGSTTGSLRFESHCPNS